MSQGLLGNIGVFYLHRDASHKTGSGFRMSILLLRLMQYSSWEFLVDGCWEVQNVIHPP